MTESGRTHSLVMDLPGARYCCGCGLPLGDVLREALAAFEQHMTAIARTKSGESQV